MEEGGGLGTRLSLVRSFANSVTLLGRFQSGNEAVSCQKFC